MRLIKSQTTNSRSIKGKGVKYTIDNVIDSSNSRIKNLANPVDDQDATTKNYVDTTVSGMKIRDLADVDSSTLDDGAIYVYDSELDVFVSQRLLDKQFINGGNF